jgi:cytoskeletal protein CcmA (bactofilin family)
MFIRRGNRRSKRIDCLIGAGTVVHGNISISGGLRVDGTVRGKIMAKDGGSATLVLSEHGRIEGEILVAHAVINGTVVGPLRASAEVELQTKAHVSGDIRYKSLEMHPGAVVRGKLIPESDKLGAEKDKVIAFKPASGD